MVAYRFQERFLDAILDGRKSHTIRAVRQGRARHARSGDRLQLYTGSRFKPKKIGEADCQACEAIDLRFGPEPKIRLYMPPKKYRPPPSSLDFVTVGVVFQGPGPLDFFARADGFDSWAQMQEFWARTHSVEDGATWSGMIIYWENFRTE